MSQNDKPALKPPPGVPAEFYNPYTLQPYMVLSAIGTVIVTTILVAARIYTKKFIVKALKWEDYTCLIGWAAFMVDLGIAYDIGSHGGGTHQWNLYESSLQYQRRYANYVDPVYSLAVLSIKLSILFLILRIFCSVHHGVGFWLTTILIYTNAIFYAIYFFIPIFVCSPRTKIYSPDEPGHCLDQKALYICSGAWNVISDIAMLSVPIYLIWNLQTSVRRKIGISAIFATGGLACISSIFRLYFHVRLVRTDDYSYVKFQTSLMATAELGFGLICSCLVVLPRLFQHLSSITPRDSKTTVPVNGGSGGQPSRRAWIEMPKQRDGASPTLPSQVHRKDPYGSDEFVRAVEGKPIDVEEGL